MFTVSRFWSVKKPPESCGIELLVLDPTMTPTSTSTIPKAKKTNVTWESVVPLATQSHHRRSTSIAKINLVCGGRREESTVMLDISQTQKSKSATCSQAWKQHQYLEVLHSVPSWTQCEHHYMHIYVSIYLRQNMSKQATLYHNLVIGCVYNLSCIRVWLHQPRAWNLGQHLSSSIGKATIAKNVDIWF